MDNFKRINDTLGRGVGDLVLKNITFLLLLSVRGSDLICRLGGDEFVVLLPETTYSGASAVFADIHITLVKSMEEHRWP